MSHEPPVPPGNTSPYPIQEPPHADDAPTLAVAPATVPATSPAAPPATAPQGQVAPAPLASAAAPAEPAVAPAAKRRVPGGVIVTGLLGVGAVVAGVTALLFGNKEAAAKPRARAKPAARGGRGK
jgi:hypothetical protein